MKILIFEYISGGGFCHSDLPAALAREGQLMLNALLEDFLAIPAHEIVLMLDARLSLPEKHQARINIIAVPPSADVVALFEKTLQNCDAAWIIAPETDNILCNFTQRVEKSPQLLLSNPSSAIAKTADKLLTFQLLSAHAIQTIPTQRLSELIEIDKFPVVIKPIDGVGCENSFFIADQTQFQEIVKHITQPELFILQPFIKGAALSVSALFKEGQGQLICVNRQHLSVKNQQFNLTACEVNIAIETTAFKKIISEIALAFPDLFGYVGIDLILSDENNALMVVEINPRLTSSYAGIQAALGINIAACVVRSVSETIFINPQQQHSVFVTLDEE